MFDDLRAIIGDIGGVVKDTVGVYGAVRDQIKGVGSEANTTVSQPAAQQPTYNPNFTARDFMFTPNWYLFGFGAVLLIVALVLMRR